jgi:hypothetical protein
MLVDTQERRTTWLQESESHSDSWRDEKEWTELWHVQVLSKVKLFLWNLAKQSLPSADVLHHRHMAQSSLCTLCGALDSWRHALLECNIARSVWVLLLDCVVDVIASVREPDASSWLAVVMGTLSHDELIRFVVTL